MTPVVHSCGFRAGRFAVRLWLLLLLSAGLAQAEPGTYLENDQFLKQVFGTVPEAQRLWLDEGTQAAAKSILGHPYGSLRVRYWRQEARAAYILEEIGKEKPITVGIVVQGDAIESVRILAFRESRGWEVKSPAFTAQFNGARLQGGDQLDRQIDGITGATMSVTAVKGVSRLALLLHARTGTATP